MDKKDSELKNKIEKIEKKLNQLKNQEPVEFTLDDLYDLSLLTAAQLISNNEANKNNEETKA